mmetsp:Transcript_21008/g.59631  ORF Transcript_21008/g.59631 Transcript_21008/m.59631 type:complete len:237 (+) Transcript_21008:88-798(+)
MAAAAAPCRGALDWPLSRQEKQRQLLRLYETDARASQALLGLVGPRRAEAALSPSARRRRRTLGAVPDALAPRSGGSECVTSALGASEGTAEQSKDTMPIDRRLSVSTADSAGSSSGDEAATDDATDGADAGSPADDEMWRATLAALDAMLCASRVSCTSADDHGTKVAAPPAAERRADLAAPLERRAALRRKLHGYTSGPRCGNAVAASKADGAALGFWGARLASWSSWVDLFAI